MTGVVLFSLYGEDKDDIYIRGAYRNCELYNSIKPDWHLKFYVGKSIPEEVRQKLLSYKNTHIVPCDGPETRAASYWRFLGIREGGYDFYLSRDTDSRPGLREISAVEEWLESDYIFHIMRDHPRHGVPMLAGMWGCKEIGTKKLRRRLRRDNLPDEGYQTDQNWLRQWAWPIVRKSVMAHVGCRWTFDMPAHDFPYPRKRWDYVAECHNGDDTLRFPEHRKEVMLPGYRARD